MTSPMVDAGAVVNLKITAEGVELPDTFPILQVRVQLGLRAVGRCTLSSSTRTTRSWGRAS